MRRRPFPRIRALANRPCDGGEKEFRPITFGRRGSGQPQWWWEGWPTPRPLYGLAELAKRPDAAVVVVEGEKACDAARKLLPMMVVVTSPNGAKSAAKADWSPLRGRSVTIWPDGDLAGAAYANAVAAAIKPFAKSVAVIEPPGGFVVTAERPEPDKEKQIDYSPLAGWDVVVWRHDSDPHHAEVVAKQIREAGADLLSVRDAGGVQGFDAADALADGWDTARAAELVAGATVVEAAQPEKKTTSGRRLKGPPPQRDQLAELVHDAELWHDQKRTAYITIPINGHSEHWPLRSHEVRMLLRYRFLKAKKGEQPGGQALEDAIGALEAQAVFDGPEYEVFVRTGSHDGKIYIDLCDKLWRVVEVDAQGWRVVEKPQVKFTRTNAMQSLPEPEGGELIEQLLHPFINVKSDNDFMLVVSWLVAAMRPQGPYPVLVF
jgi:putative DNA primase/helicase